MAKTQIVLAPKSGWRAKLFFSYDIDLLPTTY